jgi:hypothetical protein
MIGKQSDEARFKPLTTGRYVVLNMGQLSLLIPQHQVRILEPAFDVQRLKEDDVGWLTVAGVRSPVYCLSEQLQPISEVPADRHICVLLDIGGEKFGLLCNQVFMFEQAELDIMRLPECMQVPDTPLRGLVLYDEKVLCMTSAHDLLACLEVNKASVGYQKPAPQSHGSNI